MIHYRIAAAIPTRNRLNDLREAITSVLEQRIDTTSRIAWLGVLIPEVVDAALSTGSDQNREMIGESLTRATMEELDWCSEELDDPATNRLGCPGH